MNSEEREIDLRDLLYRIFLGWRLLLVCMLAGLLAGGAFGYGKAENSGTGAELSESEAQEQEESLKEVLSDEQMENIRFVREQVKEYQALIDEKKEYCENSILMQEDPSAVPTEVLLYSIDNHYEVVYPTIEKSNNIEQIKLAYESAIASEEVYQAVAKAVGGDDASEYMEEVISINGIDKGVSIQLTYLNEEGVRAMAEVVKQAVSDAYEEIREICGDFDIVLNAETYYLDINQDLLTTQSNAISQLTNLYNSKKSLTSSFSDDEQEYYDMLVEEEALGQGETETEEESAETAEASEAAPSAETVVRYLLIGALAGLFLGCCLLGVRYILSGRLCTAGDLAAYGLPCLGLIPVSGAKRRPLDGVDRYMERIALGSRREMTAEKALVLAASCIEVRLTQNQQKQVMITGTDWSGDEKLLADRLRAALAEAGFEVKLHDSFLSDGDAIREASAAGNVVLLERLRRTRFDELAREKEILSVNQLTMLGVVMAEPRIAM